MIQDDVPNKNMAIVHSYVRLLGKKAIVWLF